MLFNTLLFAAIVLLLASTSAAQQLESGDGMMYIHNESIYYIITDTHNGDQCSSEMCSNLTLNQFASNTDYYISDMTTLMLQPGDHHLDSQLLVANVRRFSLVGERERNDSIVTISCSETFTFQNLTELQIKDIQFVHCTDNHINSVGQLSIDNCMFDGKNNNGTALNIVNSVTANINCCSFILTHGSYKQFLNNDPFIFGGAIFCSSSNISIHSSVFEGNYAQVSGVLFTEQGSNLIISNCTFSNIVYSSHFSSIIVAYHGSVLIQDSIFENTNDALVKSSPSFNYRLVEVYESSILIQRSIYRNNTIYGGSFVVGFGSNITINEVLMENNTAFQCILGTKVLPSILGHLQIFYSTFINNNFNCSIVTANYLQVQVLYSHFINNWYFEEKNAVMIGAYFCNATISQSTFIENFATSIVLVFMANLTISKSVFLHNTNDVSVITALYTVDMLIDESTFFNNVQLVKNGAMFDMFYTISQGTIRIMRNNLVDNRHPFAIIKVREVTLYIDRCEFTGNSADYGATLIASYSTISISRLHVSNNVANIAGVILIYNSILNSNNISLTGNNASTAVVLLSFSVASFVGSTTLTNNRGSFFAAASTVTLEGNVSIANNMPSHTSNQIIPIEEGGAVTTLLSSVQVNGILTLMNNSADNGGALFISESRFSINGDITISNNQAKQSGGGIHQYQSRLNIQGTCSISNNTANHGGGGIYAISSTITLEDQQDSRSTSLLFFSNKAVFGGAFYLSTNTKVYVLLIASSVHQTAFIDNNADYGGALYVEDQTNTELCNSSSSTDCFFQIFVLNPENIRNAAQQQNEALNFTHNTATYVGDSIFGGLLDRCTVSHLNPLRQQGIVQQGLDFIRSVSNIDNIDLIASHPVRLCFCTENRPECSYTPLPIYVRKGETFKLSIVAVDQVNHTLESDVTTVISSNDGGLKEGQQQQSVGTNCTDVIYNVITPHDSEELLLNAVGPCGDAYTSQRRVQLVFKNCTCPIGFQTTANVVKNCECECHSNITDYIRPETCDSSTESFEPKLNAWISYTNITGQNDYYLLTHSNCPYDYCRSTTAQVSLSLDNLNDIDKKLCDLNRAGVLCGVCQSGYSVSFGSSHCIKCGKYWFIMLLGLIVLAIIAGIALVGILLFLNITVAIGTINGILFYANIINGNSSIFFNDLPIPSFPSVFIAWLNLDIGFDVCLYNGMDMFTKTLFQLGFPTYLILLVFIVIVVSKYSQKFSNMIGKKDPIATLATLILISYAKILSIIITTFSLTTLEYPDGRRLLWKPDTTIEYFEPPKHALLFIIALVILLLSSAYTIILTSWQLLVRLPHWKLLAWIRNTKLSSFIQAYHAPYISKHRYWIGLLLLVRVILYLTSALNSSGNPQLPLTAITIVIGILLLLDTKRIYRQNILNIFEVLILSNILMFTVITWYATDTNDIQLQNAAAYISVTIVFVMLLIVIVYHVYTFTKIGGIIKETKWIKSIIKLLKKTRTRPLENQATNVPNETREVDIFELVGTSTATNVGFTSQPQAKPSVSKPSVTVSTVEIPASKE